MKSIQIRNKTLKYPIIQGGMGVGVSLGNLAGHVALEGCMGVISSIGIGFQDENYEKNPFQANINRLWIEIEKAKTISKGYGMIAINMLVAATDYAEIVKEAVKAKIDAIISGAGLPLNLPDLVGDEDVAIAPIVSSGKACRVIMKSWERKYHRLPDFIVIEGTGAGGHLGFSSEELLNQTGQSLEEILKDVLAEVAPYKAKYNKDIPIFVAGSVFDGKELDHYMKLGATGAQIGTRFIATYECDAPDAFKNLIIQSGKEDLKIITSPVGMPGRAIRSPLIQKLEKLNRIPPRKCINCLIPCDFRTTKYCIKDALISAARGDLENGLFFSGSNVDRITKIVHVKDLIHEIVAEWEEAQK